MIIQPLRDETRPEGQNVVRLIKTGRMPGHRARVLVVDRDPSALAVVRSILRAQDWEVMLAKSGSEALEQARLEGPDAIITELNLADMAGTDLCRLLRERNETATTPIIVLSTSTDVAERVASLRAGATDYLVKPPDARELLARLRAALDLRRERSGFVIAVLGTKGGVGASTLAVNLAVALRQETRSGVVLFDGASRGGMVDIMLNLQPAQTGQFLPQLEDLDFTDFDAILTPHTSGVQALLLNEQGIESLNPEEMRRALVGLRKTRDFVVVDTSAYFDENTATIIGLADRLLLVLTPEITALRGAKLLLERAMQADFPRERIVPVLNRGTQRGGLQRRDIERALGLPMQAIIPDDVKLVTYSLNRGVPLVESHRRSGVARQLDTLAKSLVKAALQQ